MMRLLVFLWIGLGVGCIEAPPQSLPEIEDMTTVDMGSDEGQDDTGVLPEPVDPTCTDRLQNQEETDVDCGGPNCGGCGLGRGCVEGTDCVSGRCDAGSCVVQEACLVSDEVAAQEAYDSGCTAIEFPAGEFDLDFTIERSIELSGAGRDTKLGKAVFRGSSDSVTFLLTQVSFIRLAEGAIDHQGGHLRVLEVAFEGNSNPIRGGAIFSNGAGRLDVINCEFRENSSQQGGAIYANYDAPDERLSVLGSSFIGNFAAGEGAVGGAIFVDHGTATLDETTFTGNYLKDGQGTTLSGGAIHSVGPRDQFLRIKRSIFEANNVSSSNGVAEGGAVSIRGQNLQISESYFNGNGVDGNTGLGGAVAAVDASITVAQSTFHQNAVVGTEAISRGGAIHAQGVSKSLLVLNSTFSDQDMNGPDRRGSALFLSELGYESYSNTFTENRDESVVVEFQGPNSDVVILTNNTIYGDETRPTFPDSIEWSGTNIVAEPVEPEGKFDVGDPGLADILEVEGMWVHIPMVNSLPRTLAGPCAGPRGEMHLEQDQLNQARPNEQCTIGAVQVFEVE